MSDNHHRWQTGSVLPVIRPHSVAKHRVIQQYLSRYVEVLTANLRIPELCLTLVDGFAGGGLYRDSRTNAERYGSPLLMLSAMQEAAVLAQCKRSKEFKLDVEYIFVERSVETFACLKANLERSEFRELLKDKVELINDAFVNRVNSIITQILRRARGNRAILFSINLVTLTSPFQQYGKSCRNWRMRKSS